MDTKISRDLTQYPHPVKLLWEIMPNGGKWNEVCAWTIEHLGLPGNRYCTEVAEDYMIWHFEDIRDKLMFTVAWGNHDTI